jgi:hypothetical protein
MLPLVLLQILMAQFLLGSMKKVIMTTPPTNVLQEKFVDITHKSFGQNQQK